MLNHSLLIANNVGDEGVKYLSESLKVNSTLTHLELSGKPDNVSVIVMCN